MRNQNVTRSPANIHEAVILSSLFAAILVTAGTMYGVLSSWPG
jgi:hypothetical protein